MRTARVALGLTLLVGCTFPDAQVRKRAAVDFGCPEEKVAIHGLGAGYLARGCWKEAEYRVRDGQAIRTTEIARATVDDRPEIPIDRIPGTNSVGVR